MWSAPETRQGIEYTQAVDVWGLGALTFFMVMTYPPFNDFDEDRLNEKVQNCNYD
jgi:serine/threonine protein kinase